MRRRILCSAVMLLLAAAAHPQPVPLRLAKSLCTSETMQVLANQLVPPLASSAAASASVNASTAQALRQGRAAFVQKLAAVRPFSGVYVTGDGGRIVDDPGSRYSVGLEWELFRNGRAEARRQLDRSRLDEKIQYVQLQRDVEQRELQEQLLAIDNMRSRLLAALWEREAAAIRPVLERHRLAAKAGRMTRAELAETEFRYERAQLRARHYGGAHDVLVYPQAHELINRIESVALQPVAELADRAAARSPEYELQDLLAARADFLPALQDNRQVSVFVERSKDFDRGPHSVAGVRWRIPLGRDTGRDEAIVATRDLYAQQRESLRAAMAQKLALLAERLRLAQDDMRVLQAENRMLRTKTDVACYRLDYPVATVGTDAERDVEDGVLRLYEKQREILAARLDILEVLTQLSALVKPREPSELYTLQAAP